MAPTKPHTPSTRAKSTPDQRTATAKSSQTPWPQKTELLSLTFDLKASKDYDLYSQYSIGLHAWFLQQIQESNPELSQILHDEASEKAFTVSGLDGAFVPSGQQLRLVRGKTYRWTVTALSKPLVQWLSGWLDHLPQTLDLRNAPLAIHSVKVDSATTYKALGKLPYPEKPKVALSFTSPTSFRSRGRHLPLPIPRNIFHSYLRRWNDLSDQPTVDQTEFLDWLDDHVIILRHGVRSLKVAAGKRGSVTGFIGAIEMGLTGPSATRPEFVQLFCTLGQFAPYCGTGHKTTFGLGQTRLGWTSPDRTDMAVADPAAQTSQLLAQRIDDLTARFMAQRKRQGGDRARSAAEIWATALARREFGESLMDIAEDMGLKHETVKSYVKRARKSLRD
ncbi:MAG: CRISPR-associated endoribonuclease Cas6 [Elainellaceae cyanobacterium]